MFMTGNTQPTGLGTNVAVKADGSTGRLEVENHVWNGTLWVPVLAQPDGSQRIGLAPDARSTKLSGGLWTLGSASVVESVAVPDWANGFRLRPSADTRFAVGEDPAASGAETLTTGNTAYANETEVRLLESGTGRTLRLLTTSAGSTVGVGFF